MTTAAVPLFLWSSAVLIASGDSVLVDGSLGLADAVDGRVCGALLLRLLLLLLLLPLVEAAVLVVEALLLLPGVVDGVVCGVVVLWLPPDRVVVEPLPKDASRRAPSDCKHQSAPETCAGCQIAARGACGGGGQSLGGRALQMVRSDAIGQQ